MGVNGIYGLSGSGLDVESMVKVGMLGKQSEYDKMQQKYTKNEWTKAEFLDLYGELQTFNSSTLSQYKLSSNMNARAASSSNESALTATANASAALMTHHVKVNGLASNVYLVGTETISRVNDNEATKNQIANILFSEISKDADGKIYVNGDSSTLYDADDTAVLFSIDDGVNVTTGSDETATGTYVMTVSQVAEAPETLGANMSDIFGITVNPTDTVTSTLTQLATELASDATIGESMVTSYIAGMADKLGTTAIEFDVSDGTNNATVSYTYSELSELMDGTKTLSDFITSINNKLSGTNVTASLSDDGTIALSNSVTGEDSKISISMDFDKALGGLRAFRSLPQALQQALQQAYQEGTATDTAIANVMSSVYSDGSTKFDGVAAGLVYTLLMGQQNASGLISNGTATIENGTVQYTISGKNATGTITNPDGSSETFEVASNTFTQDGVTFNITSTTDENGVKVSKLGSQQIAITYGELANGFTLNELASKINGLGGNVKATYDTVQDRFSIYNKESGSKNQLNLIIASNNTAGSDAEQVVGTNTANLFNAFSLQQSTNGTLSTEGVLKLAAGDTKKLEGKDGGVTIDGVGYTLESNKTTVNGVMYNFLNTTDTDTITVTVTQDTAGIVDKVKSFVSDYNALLTKLYEWYDEKPNSDYKPLTASQKDAMKEEQIEKWEEKAKAGLLYHDKTLGKIITDLRAAVSEKVEGITGKYNTIFAVGISTTGLKGQLKLDEDKLNAALAEDPDAVYNIFAKLDGGEKQYLVESGGRQFWTTNKSLGTVVTRNGEEVTKTVERSSYNGVAQRLGDIFMTAMKSVKSVAGSSAEITEDSELNNLMRELQTKMSNFKRMMAAFETQLYKKYDAMESSLALLGAQLNYVTGAFQ